MVINAFIVEPPCLGCALMQVVSTLKLQDRRTGFTIKRTPRYDLSMIKGQRCSDSRQQTRLKYVAPRLYCITAA